MNTLMDIYDEIDVILSILKEKDACFHARQCVQ